MSCNSGEQNDQNGGKLGNIKKIEEEGKQGPVDPECNARVSVTKQNRDHITPRFYSHCTGSQ